MAGRSGLALSRGALKSLVSHSWPGNIRELKHLIITAAVMAEGNVIQAEQLGLEVDTSAASVTLEERHDPAASPVVAETQGGEAKVGGSAEADDDRPMDLNPRQQLACDHIRTHGSITSKDLLELLQGTISKRTASYDIQDLVNRGILRRVGRGPSTRYVPAVDNGPSPGKTR